MSWDGAWMSASNAAVWGRVAVYSTLEELRRRMLCLRTSDWSVARWNRHGLPFGGRVVRIRRQPTLAVTYIIKFGNVSHMRTVLLLGPVEGRVSYVIAYYTYGSRGLSALIESISDKCKQNFRHQVSTLVTDSTAYSKWCKCKWLEVGRHQFLKPCT